MAAAEPNSFTNYNISSICGVVLQPPQQTIYAAAKKLEQAFASLVSAKS
jgi:hypothetical protein